MRNASIAPRHFLDLLIFSFPKFPLHTAASIFHKFRVSNYQFIHSAKEEVMRKMSAIEGILLVSVVLLVLLPCIASAQWIPDGTPVCTELSHQYEPCIVSDGSGGAIIAWVDLRNGNNNIYAQRIDADGNVQWLPNGNLIINSAGTVSNPVMIPDGAGGAIIAWEDQRNGNGDIFAQRVASDGTIQWWVNAMAICTEAEFQGRQAIASDGAGGAIITWMDYRSSNYDVYAQRITASGVVQWTTNGIVVCATTGPQNYPDITSDGSGGAIIAWRDSRGTDADIYAQRINSAGVKQWAPDGVAICTASGSQGAVKIASDGAGGGIMVWLDNRSPFAGVYVRKVDLGGLPRWTADGVRICSDLNRRNPQIISDGAGGAITCWDGPGRLPEPWYWQWGIFASKINSVAVIQWGVEGVDVYQDGQHGTDFYLDDAQLVSDGAGGAIITWSDDRYSRGIHAQRVNSSGDILWGTDGKDICMADNDQGNPQLISDGATGAIITWDDQRTPANETDIYAQRIYEKACEVSPASLDYGTIMLGNYLDLIFTIRNIGSITLSGSVSESSPHYSIVSTVPPDDPYNLENGEELEVTVRFDPAYVGLHLCTIDTGDEICTDVLCTGIGCSSGVLLYVDADASGIGDGSSWLDAITELRDAFTVAHACSGVTEIWVAEGTYTPTDGTDRNATFALRNDLELYGGFAGTEIQLDDRDIAAHPTMLSGDIGVLADSTDNSYHVVTGSGTDSTAVLDGFTVTSGRADGAGNDNNGGGMYISSGSPTIANVIFSKNFAGSGGGMFNDSSSPTLSKVIFSQNSASNYGGGMRNSNYSDPILIDVAVSGNSAGTDGGGIGNSTQSSPELTNVVISGNYAGRYGGGMKNSWRNNTVLTNVIFSGNSSVSSGGGMYNTESSNGELINATFSGNTALGLGGGIYNSDSDLTLTNCILWGDSAAVRPGSTSDEICAFYPIMGDRPFISYSLIEGCGGSGGGWDGYLGIDGGNNIDVDPRFRGAYSPDSPLSLWSSSPAINAGDNTAVPGGVTTDIGGDPRIYGGIVDMGAYEYQGPATGVDDIPQAPDAFALYQNVPNPFNPTTRIRFDLPQAVQVKLSIYNVKGELVSTIVDKHLSEGRKEVTWSAKDNRGRAVSSGIYFYRLVAGDFVQTKKIVLLR